MSAVAGRTPQRMTALIEANEVRIAQKEWKAEMAALPPTPARREAVRVLLEDPDSVGALTIHAFLVAIPRVGEQQARRILSRRGWYVWPFRRVRELTERERRDISERLLAGAR